MEIYEELSSESPSADVVHSRVNHTTLSHSVSSESCTSIYTPIMQAQQWVIDFVDLGRLEGYQKKNVTPYMHCLVYHVPHQIRTHGNILKFSGQGIYIQPYTHCCR